MNKDIKCDASNCVYHDGACECTADHINVDWVRGCDCTEAQCSTFTMKTDAMK